jgi:hypothetical protein
MGFNSAFKGLMQYFIFHRSIQLISSTTTTFQGISDQSSEVPKFQHLVSYAPNWVLRKIFGPKRYEMKGVWTRLSNDKLHNLYCSPNTIRIIKKKETIGACSTKGGEKSCVQGLGVEL